MARLVVASVLLLLAACDRGPHAGDSCIPGMAGGCANDHAELECENNHYIEVPCRGSGGCSVGEDVIGTAQMTCDVSGNLDTDRCARATKIGELGLGGQSNTGACSADCKSIVVCQDGAFHHEMCPSPQTCVVYGTELKCVAP